MNISSSVNKQLVYFLTVLTILGLHSCSSVMKCDVYGHPGTKIYKYDGTYVGTINHSGKAELKLSRKQKYDLLYAKESDDSPIIPIGLNYDKRANNEVGLGLLAVIGAPFTIGLSAWQYDQYIKDNEDVKDQLKLCKQQSSNTDLTKLVYSSSNPLDEIKALPVKQHKHGKHGKTKDIAIPWINKDGSITKVTSVESHIALIDEKPRSLSIGEDLRITFSFFEDNSVEESGYTSMDPTIKLSGTLNGDSNFKYRIKLNGLFRKDKDGGYSAKNKENNTVVRIIPKSPSQATLSFDYQMLSLDLIFDIDSFEEEPDINKDDFLQMLLNMSE